MIYWFLLQRHKTVKSMSNRDIILNIAALSANEILTGVDDRLTPTKT